MRRTLNTWKLNDLMGMLVSNSIVYYFFNLLATILMMISIWGVPGNSTYFAAISACTQNELTVVIPRLVISFRETYDEDGQPSQHGRRARQMVRSGNMVFARRAMTDGFELQTVDREQPQRVEESA